MITTSDINKLKTVFATKDDLLEVKKDIVVIKKDIVGIKKDVVDIKKDIVGVKKDIIGVKNDIRDVISGIHTIIEMVGEEKTKNKEHDDILEQHERRLDKIEDKVFSSN